MQIGALVAGTLLPLGALVIGWRPTLMATGVLAALGVVATRAVIPETPSTRAPGSTKMSRRTRSIVSWLSPYGFLMAGGMAINTAYLPLFANEIVGLGASQAGMLVAVLGGFGVLGRVLWGWAAGATASVISLLAWISLGSIVSQGLIWGSPTIGVWAVWAGTAVLGATAIAWLSVGMVVLVRDAGKHDLGRGTGMVQLWFYAGFVAFPVVAGLTVDRTGTYGYGWAISLATFALSLIVSVSWMRRERKTRPEAGVTHE